MKQGTKTFVFKDLTGGLSSAIVSLSGNIVFGLIAFAPLGSAWLSAGIMAGFYSSIIIGLLAALIGGTPGLISGPRAPTTLIFASVLIMLLAQNKLPAENILVLAFFTVFMAGVIQIAFGLFRLGSLIKFISYPVIAGFLNATALLIFLSQIWNLCGLEKQASILEIINLGPAIKWLSVLIALFTAAVIFICRKISKYLPGSMIALVLGALLYHMFVTLGLENYLGQCIQTVGLQIPFPRYAAGFFNLFSEENWADTLFALIPAAFSIAVLSSTDSLLTSVSVQNQTKKRTNANRELIGQGIGNTAASFFGSIPGAGSISRSLANVQSGGRTRLSGVFNALIMVIVLFTLTPYISLIPKAVIAGIVLTICLNMFDKWSLRLVKRLFSRQSKNKAVLLINLGIVTAIILIALFANLIMAVAAGISLSILMFVYKMSQSTVIRRSYSGSKVHSKRQRDDRLMELISRHGALINILELEGSVFFASADSLQESIEELTGRGSDYIILDMQRVKEIDSTGAVILEQTYHKLKEKQKVLCLSYMDQQNRHHAFLKDMGLFSHISKEHIFTDTDRALEYFENLIIKRFYKEIDARDKAQFTVFKGFKAAEMKILKQLLKKHTYQKNEYIFRQGDRGKAIYFIAKGMADVTINLPGMQRKRRLQTLSTGTFFGEMALIENKPRSANIKAATDLICYVLDLASYAVLKKDYPLISVKFLGNISKTIATRLRFANISISELER